MLPRGHMGVRCSGGGGGRFRSFGGDGGACGPAPPGPCRAHSCAQPEGGAPAWQQYCAASGHQAGAQLRARAVTLTAREARARWWRTPLDPPPGTHNSWLCGGPRVRRSGHTPSLLCVARSRPGAGLRAGVTRGSVRLWEVQLNHGPGILYGTFNNPTAPWEALNRRLSPPPGGARGARSEERGNAPPAPLLFWAH